MATRERNDTHTCDVNIYDENLNTAFWCMREANSDANLSFVLRLFALAMK